MSPTYSNRAGKVQSLYDDARDLTEDLVSGAYFSDSLQQLVLYIKSILTGAGIGAFLTTIFVSRLAGPKFRTLRESLQVAEERKLDMAIWHVLKMLKLRPDFENLVLNQTDQMVGIVKGIIEEMYAAYLLQAEERDSLASYVGIELRNIHHDRKKRAQGSDVPDSLPASKRQRYAHQINGYLAPPDRGLLPSAPLSSRSENFESQGVAAPGWRDYVSLKEDPLFEQNKVDSDGAAAKEKRRVACLDPQLPSSRKKARQSKHQPWSGNVFFRERPDGVGNAIELSRKFSDSSDHHKSGKPRLVVKKKAHQAYVSEGSEELENGVTVPSPSVSRSQTRGVKDFGSPPKVVRIHEPSASPVDEREITDPWGRDHDPLGRPVSARLKIKDRFGKAPNDSEFAAREAKESESLLSNALVKNRLDFGNSQYPGKAKSSDLLVAQGKKLSVIEEEATSTDETPMNSLHFIDGFFDELDRNQAEVDALARELGALGTAHERLEHTQLSRDAESTVDRRKSSSSTSRQSFVTAASEPSTRKPSSSASRKSSATWSSSSRKSSGASRISYPLSSLYPEYDTIFTNPFSEEEIQRQLNETYASSRRSSSSIKPSNSQQDPFTDDLIDAFDLEDLLASPPRRSTHPRPRILEPMPGSDFEEIPPPTPRRATRARSRIHEPRPGDDLWLEALPPMDHRSMRVILPSVKAANQPSPPRPRNITTIPAVTQPTKVAPATVSWPTKKPGRPSMSPPQPSKSIRSQNPPTKSSGAAQALKKRARSAPPATDKAKIPKARVPKRRRSAASYRSSGSSSISSSGEDAQLAYAQALRRGSGVVPAVKKFTRFGPRRSSRIRDVVDLHRGDLNERRLFLKAWRRRSQ